MNQKLKQLYAQKKNAWDKMELTSNKLKSGIDLSEEESADFEIMEGQLRMINDMIKAEEKQSDLEAIRATKGIKAQRGTGGRNSLLHDEEDQADNFGESKEGVVIKGFTIYNKSKPVNTAADFVQRNFDCGEAANLSVGSVVKAWLRGAQNDVEQRALSEGTDSAGGFTVPKITSARLIDNVRAKSRVFQAGAVAVLLDSNQQTMAKITADATASWVGESGAITPSDPTFGSVSFNAKSLKATIITSLELLQDGVNIAEAISSTLYGAFASEFDRSAVQGAGTATEPKGIFNYTSPSVYSMGTNGAAFNTWDVLIDAIKVMLDNNCDIPNAAIMSPRTWAAINKLKEVGTAAPMQRPEVLKNLNFMETSKVSNTQTQGSSNVASSIYMGGFENLYFGTRLETTLYRTNEKLASNGQFSFVAVARGDWQPRREADFGLIKGVL